MLGRPEDRYWIEPIIYFMHSYTSVILPKDNFLRIIMTFTSFFSDCQISHDLWPLTSISAMLHPPKPTNGAQILIRQVFLHKNQSSNLLYPSDPVLSKFWIWLPNYKLAQGKNLKKIEKKKNYWSYVSYVYFPILISREVKSLEDCIYAAVEPICGPEAASLNRGFDKMLMKTLFSHLNLTCNIELSKGVTGTGVTIFSMFSSALLLISARVISLAWIWAFLRNLGKTSKYPTNDSKRWQKFAGELTKSGILSVCNSMQRFDKNCLQFTKRH